MDVAANKALIRRYYDDLWNQWNLDLVEEILAHDVAFRGSLGIAVHGRDGFRRYVALVRSAFPDFHNLVEDLVAEADRVVARMTYRGTHRGPLFGIAPTGRAVSYMGIALFRIAGSRIVEGWVIGDTPGLLRQLGREPW
jgi:steroid delta-isomerase-like uncharacterized protein